MSADAFHSLANAESITGSLSTTKDLTTTLWWGSWGDEDGEGDGWRSNWVSACATAARCRRATGLDRVCLPAGRNHPSATPCTGTAGQPFPPCTSRGMPPPLTPFCMASPGLLGTRMLVVCQGGRRHAKASCRLGTLAIKQSPEKTSAISLPWPAR